MSTSIWNVDGELDGEVTLAGYVLEAAGGRSRCGRLRLVEGLSDVGIVVLSHWSTFTLPAFSFVCCRAESR